MSEELGDAIALRDEVEAYRELWSWVRPHESLGQLPPIARYLGEQPADPIDPTYPSPGVSRILDAGHRGRTTSIANRHLTQAVKSTHRARDGGPAAVPVPGGIRQTGGQWCEPQLDSSFVRRLRRRARMRVFGRADSPAGLCSDLVRRGTRRAR